MHRQLLLIFLGLFAFCACELPHGSRPGRSDMIASHPLDGTDMDIVWTVVNQQLERSGYHLDELNSSEPDGKFETQWRLSLLPLRYKGQRRKIVGRIEPVAGRHGVFRVLAAVWVQRNANLKNPMDPSMAIWQDMGSEDSDARTFAKMFLYRVEQALPEAPSASAKEEDR